MEQIVEHKYGYQFPFQIVLVGQAEEPSATESGIEVQGINVFRVSEYRLFLPFVDKQIHTLLQQSERLRVEGFALVVGITQIKEEIVEILVNVFGLRLEPNLILLHKN